MERQLRASLFFCATVLSLSLVLLIHWQEQRNLISTLQTSSKNSFKAPLFNRSVWRTTKEKTFILIRRHVFNLTSQLSPAKVPCHVRAPRAPFIWFPSLITRLWLLSSSADIWLCTPTSPRRPTSWSWGKGRCIGWRRSVKTAGSKAPRCERPPRASSRETTWPPCPGQWARKWFTRCGRSYHISCIYDLAEAKSAPVREIFPQRRSNAVCFLNGSVMGCRGAASTVLLLEREETKCSFAFSWTYVSNSF